MLIFSPLNLLVLPINNFKQINNTLILNFTLSFHIQTHIHEKSHVFVSITEKKQ